MNPLLFVTLTVCLGSVYAAGAENLELISSALEYSENDVSETRNGGSACLNEINAERRNQGLGNLAADNRLVNGAYRHNKYMVDNNCFSHQCDGEPSVSQRISNEGYSWSSWAENIAKGQRDCPAVVRAWMNSNGHRRNILGNFRNIGCNLYNTHWTCKFASPR